MNSGKETAVAVADGVYEVFVAIPANSLIEEMPGEFGERIFHSHDRSAAIGIAEGFIAEQQPESYTLQVRQHGKIVWAREQTTVD